PVSVAGMTVARAEAGNLFQGSNLGLSGTGTIDLLSLGKGPIVDSSSIGNKHGSGSSVGSSGGTNPFAAIQQLIDTPTADGQVTIPENILNDSNVMVIPNSGDTIMYDQTAKQWYRQETNGNKTMISNDVFNSDGLKDISKRVVLDSSRDVYVDQVTGMETPRVPTYTWDDNKGSVKKHSLTGEKNSHKYPTGLHYGDEMIRQINDGTVFPVKDDGEKILDAVSAAKTSDGGIAVTRADSSVVTFKPNDDGLVSMGWGYTNRPQLVKMPSSTLFPLDYTEDDIKDCVNAFLSPDADKRIVHMGGYIAKGQRHYSTEYEFVYTKDGKKLLLGAQVNDDILRSIYPIDKNLTVQQRPNSYK
ncbi:MAG: EndoU domain-containing protein, partial [Bacilli bacterium]|nr:EndoU domain-containing protein [Bacilli bacterium]